VGEDDTVLLEEEAISDQMEKASKGNEFSEATVDEARSQRE